METINDHPAALLTIHDVARWLNLSTRTILRYIAEGMPAHKLGRSVTSPWRFDREEVDAWLRSRCFDRTGGAAA